MKIALGIEYNGKQYCGWQRQEKVRSVQEELEKALSFVANEKIFSCFCRTCALWLSIRCAVLLSVRFIRIYR